MAADDDRGPEPDPWDEIEAEDLGAEGGEISYRFEESTADEPDQSGPAGGSDPAAAPEAAADDNVADWLSDDDGADEAAVPPLSVFTPEDVAGGSSAIDIGTGTSGIGLHGEADPEKIGTDSFAGIIAADVDPLSEDGTDSGTEHAARSAEGAEGLGAWDVTAGVAAAAAAGGAPRPRVSRPAKPAKQASPIGQLIGVVMGGLLAIPITLAILIYGLGKDPFGVTKKVPEEVAFLLPAKFRPGFKKPVAADTDVAAAGGSALDDLPAVGDPAEPAAPPDEPAVEEPGDAVDAVADMPPEPAPATDVVAVDPPGLDELVTKPAPAPVQAPEPPPLDTAVLDEAVAEAAALGEALGAVDDRENGAYRKLRTRWYQALARVAEELVAVEHAAATSGRPLAAAPDNVTALHGGIGRREALAAELVALAPQWLAYAKRGSDGVVLPLTFESARRVGPYWTVRATLTGSDGQPRDLTVISRSEPAAIIGDRIVVTGVALDGSVIWAADIRGGLGANGDAPPGF